MMSRILDGSACSYHMKQDIKTRVDDFTTRAGRPPGLMVVLASDDEASNVYVSRKVRACQEVGILSFTQVFKKNCSWHGCDTAEKFVKKILTEKGFVDATGIDGVLVQLPIAGVSDAKPLFDLIPPEKDVDVFHPQNVGRLVQGRPRFETCTPAGILRLLAFHDIPVKGKSVCIINDSDIVGKPLSTLLLQAGATVTVCHKHTPPSMLQFICLCADIVVVAVGIPGFLKGNMVNEETVVVDVGINRLPDGKVVGDVHESVWERAAWVSPVPGGVGPMTVTMLLHNTLQAAIGRNPDLFYKLDSSG